MRASIGTTSLPQMKLFANAIVANEILVNDILVNDMATKPRYSSRNAPPSRPAWLVFIGGLAAGVFATMLVTMWLPLRTSQPTAAKPVPTAPGAVATVGAPRDEVKYQFDGMLKASEVPVQDKNAAVSETSVSTAPTPTTDGTPARRMLLQAGSFRAAGDADSLRAELLLLAVGQVSTRETLLPSGEIWYRVFIGPFANDATLRTVQARLTRQNIDTFPIAAPVTTPRKPAPPPP